MGRPKGSKTKVPTLHVNNAPRTVPAASLANLIPIQPGEVRNKYGRAGKDGTGGFSLKATLKNYLNNLPKAEKDNFFSGLYRKVREGDVAAIKLIAELNGEMVTQVEVQNALGCVILPPKAPKETGDAE